jgi:hypothetical protein
MIVLHYLGLFLAALGVPFFVRGWIFSLRPEGAVSAKARERNLRLGLETDMRRWGRRVRRFGLLLLGIGLALAYVGRGAAG